MSVPTDGLTEFWMVKSIKPEFSVNVLGISKTLTFEGLADGCVGVSLWFKEKEAALDYANGDESLLERGTPQEAGEAAAEMTA